MGYKVPDSSSKFYSRSLTLLIPILKMIKDGMSMTEIAHALNIEKSHVSYYVKRAKEIGYVKESFRDRIKILELTQPGKNFVDRYEKHHVHPPYRLENIRFKAPVISMPAISVDWHKVEMNNWSQYGFTVDDTKVHLNNGTNPTIEFILSAIDGDDPHKLIAIANYDCMQVAKKLEETLDMKIGSIEPSSRAEYVAYDPGS
jgi:DNA-binding MarR family transcriptional regulator